MGYDDDFEYIDMNMNQRRSSGNNNRPGGRRRPPQGYNTGRPRSVREPSYGNPNYGQYRNNSSNMNMQRRRPPKSHRRNEFMKSLIPALIAIGLIIVIAVVALTSGVLDDLKYSSDRADLNAYFNAGSDREATLITDNQVSDNKVHLINGQPYLLLDDVNEEFHDRFYYDVETDSYLYTRASSIDRAKVGDTTYTINGANGNAICPMFVKEGDNTYISFEHLGNYKDISYKICGGNGEPYRVEIKDEWGNIDRADIVKDQAIRIDQNKKSSILKDVKVGDTVTVLSTEGEWAKVKTDDLIIGYIETKFIDNVRTEAEPAKTGVTEDYIPSNTKDTPIVLTWNNVAGSAANADVASRLNSAPGINVMSPTWLTVTDDEGNISSIGSREYVETCHSKGVDVWVVFDNLQHLEVSSFEIFSKASKRQYMISQLMSYIGELGADGINLDIESIPAESGEHYVQFIRELSIECRNSGIVLSVDNYVPKGFNDFYNRHEQGVFADYVIIMGYDEHYTGSEKAGSVASIGYVTDGIESTLEEVPASKIINAVPLYTRLWEEIPKSESELADEGAVMNADGIYVANDGSDREIIPYKLEVQTLPMGDAMASVRASGAQVLWDEETGQNYATWNKGNSTYEVWLEDEQSLSAKLTVMKDHGIAGVAAWQVVYAEDYVWPLFSSFY